MIPKNLNKITFRRVAVGQLTRPGDLVEQNDGSLCALPFKEKEAVEILIHYNPVWRRVS